MGSGRQTVHEGETMILVLGGTTEGRLTAGLLDELRMPFIYSTKTPVEPFATSYGVFRHGALLESAIGGFLSAHHITKVIDAAHPFAARLHWLIFNACRDDGVRLMRFERPSPVELFASLEDNGIVRVHDFEEAIAVLEEIRPLNLLALTGVQSIAPLRSWWRHNATVLRILPVPSSLQIADEQGFPQENLILTPPSESQSDLESLIRIHNVDCVLTKESGASGFLPSKIRAAAACAIPLVLIMRPPNPDYRHLVTSLDELRNLLLC
jgi:precorrin-6x reductase